MLIRPATPSDASRLAEILVFAKRCAYRAIFHDDHVSFCTMNVLDLARAFQESPSTLEGVDVYDDGIVKGMLRGGPSPETDNPGGIQIHELYVDPFFQGSGVGGALLRHFLATEEVCRAEQVLLWVLKENLRARALYEHFGFHPNGVQRAVIGTQVTELLYSLR